MELDPVSASSMGEDRLEAQGKQMEKEIQRIRVEAEQCRRSYVSRVCALLNTVNGLSEKMDEVLRMVDEIELIKQQQREIERQCEMLEEMSDVVPEILDLTRSIDVLESRMGQTKKSDDEESNQRMSAPPLVPIPQSTIPEASLKFRSSPPSNRSSSDISSNVLFSSTHSSAIRSLPKKSSPLPHRSPPPLSTIPSHTTSPHKSPPPPISLPPSLKSPPPPMPPSLKSPLSSTSPPPSLNSPPPPMPPPPSLKSPSPKSSSLTPTSSLSKSSSTSRSPPPLPLNSPPHRSSPKSPLPSTLKSSLLPNPGKSVTSPPKIPPHYPRTHSPEHFSTTSEHHSSSLLPFSGSLESRSKSSDSSSGSVDHSRTLQDQSPQEQDEEFVIMKPSQMREKMELLERLNSANRNQATRCALYQRHHVGEESNDKMPSLYQQFAPPPRPQKR